MQKAVLYGVGIAPGGPELLTPKAEHIIEECPVIAATQMAKGHMLALDIVKQAVDLQGKQIQALSFAMSRNPKILKTVRAAVAEQILEQLEQGQYVALLNLGDVSIYATFHSMKAFMEARGYSTVVILGVPSFCAVTATLGEILTPQMDSPLHIIPAGFENWEEALAFPGTKVVMKAGKPLEELKHTLHSTGLYSKAKLVQNCGLPEEQIAYTLEEAEENGGYFTTMVVQP